MSKTGIKNSSPSRKLRRERSGSSSRRIIVAPQISGDKPPSNKISRMSSTGKISKPPLVNKSKDGKISI